MLTGKHATYRTSWGQVVVFSCVKRADKTRHDSTSI